MTYAVTSKASRRGPMKRHGGNSNGWYVKVPARICEANVSSCNVRQSLTSLPRFNQWRKQVRHIVTIVLFLLASQAFAEAYVGARLGGYSIDVDGVFDNDLEFSGVMVGAYGGYMMAPWIGVELSYTYLAESDDSAFVLGQSIRVEVSAQSFGLHLRPTWPVSDTFSLYSRVGVDFFDAEVTASAGGLSFTEDAQEEEFSWSIGMEWHRDMLGFGIEVGRVETEEPTLIAGGTLSYRF